MRLSQLPNSVIAISQLLVNWIISAHFTSFNTEKSSQMPLSKFTIMFVVSKILEISKSSSKSISQARAEA
jgi:hypothetical protein